MATILVVDDNPANREALKALLSHHGHQPLDAADGLQALALVREKSPQLVIADVLMPTMDGYEFVRRLRCEPAISRTPVIFYTAAYQEREAQELAKACGVSHIITKPSEPKVILATIAAALSLAPPPSPAPKEEFDREHLRLLTDKLSRQVEELETARLRLEAVLRVGQKLASEHDPRLLLEEVCSSARKIIGARFAAVVLLEKTEDLSDSFFVAGLDAKTAAQVCRLSLDKGILARLLAEGHPIRMREIGLDPAAAGFPEPLQSPNSLLGVRIASPSGAYGVLYLLKKLAAEEFSEADEQVAVMLASQTAVSLENARRHREILWHWGELEREINERKQTEQALRESQERYRIVAETASDAIVTIDTSSRILFVNPGAERIFGYSVAELLGAELPILMPERFRDAHRAALARYLETGRRGMPWGGLQIPGRHKNGEEIPLEISFGEGVQSGNRVFTAIIRDITERKKAEEAARTSQERFELVTRASNDAVWDCDLTTGHLWWNDNVRTLFGYRENEIGADSTWWSERVHPDDRERVVSAIRGVTRDGGRFWSSEYRFRRSDGSFADVFDRGYVLRDSEGKPLRMVGAMQDISFRKRAEEELRRSESNLAEAQRIACLGSWEHDLTAGELRWSAEVYRIFGVNPAEFRPTRDSFLSFVHPDDRPAVQAKVQEALHGKRPYSVDHRIVRPDGSERIVHEQAEVIPDNQGNPIRMAGTVQDITERRVLEAQFQQAQKMEAIGKLAGGVAHDFNNLLGVILLYSELLQEGLRPDNPLRPHIDEIRKAAERGAALTGQLLAFSRKQVLEPRILNLNETVRDMEIMLRRLAGEQIHLAAAYNARPGLVKADPGQLAQVIMNLAVNARDAMPTGGKLTIETADVELDESYAQWHAAVEPGPYVMLAISDTGIGISPEIQSRIFEPFFTTKEKGKGTGLGLATVYGIVKQSGGYIWVYSEVGHGTTFKIYLPKQPLESAPRPSRDRETPESSGLETILLVEDEAPLREATCESLRRRGYIVLEAASGAEAAKIAANYSLPIHVLVTDVMMPGISGHELARELERKRPGMRVLYVSGYTDDAIMNHGVLESGLAFLQKPYMPRELVRKIQEVLNGIVK